MTRNRRFHTAEARAKHVRTLKATADIAALKLARIDIDHALEQLADACDGAPPQDQEAHLTDFVERMNEQIRALELEGEPLEGEELAPVARPSIALH